MSMDFCKEDSARFENPLIVAEINTLATTVRTILSISEVPNNQDGYPVSIDLDLLATTLLKQIIACVPREKQLSILIANNLEEYSEELDAMWAQFVEEACIE